MEHFSGATRRVHAPREITADVVRAWHLDVASRAPTVRARAYAFLKTVLGAAGENVLASLPSCPIPEIARLGRTLRRWKDQFLAYFTTARANNGGTEAIGIIEIHRRIARGFRNPGNYRLRMILVGGGLTHPDIR